MEDIPTREDILQKKSWIGGPTHTLQRQHIPGYSGHVPRLKAESLFSKPFAKMTADCLNDRLETGIVVDNTNRFNIHYGVEYKEPNLRKNDIIPPEGCCQLKGNRPFNEDIIFPSIPKTIEDIPPIDRVHVIGYMGFKPVYKYPLKQVIDQPIIKDPYENTRFNNLSKGFQTQLLSDSNIRKKVCDQKVPIVGYTGFLPGIKSKNVFGKSYKEACYDSKDHTMRDI